MKSYLPSVFVVHPFLARITLAGLLLFTYSVAYAQGISIVSGNGQLVCSQCPTRSFQFDPLVVAVKDARGTPVPNAVVSWTVNNDRGVDGRVGAISTTTGADGASTNTYFVSSPITLLTPFLQGTVTASAMGSSVTFTETNGAVAPGGIAQLSSNLQSPIPGTTLTGSPGSMSSIPVRIAVSTFFPGGPVAGAEIRVESDPNFPATAACSPASVLTNAAGVATCNLVFGNITGEGKIKIHVGNNYDIYGPIHIQVGSGPGNPPGTPKTQLSVTPSSLSYVYPGPVTQSVSVVSSNGPVTYTAAVQVTIAQVSWLAVGASSSPATSGVNSTFSVTVVPQGLQVGTYRASIAVHPGDGSPDVIIPVTLAVQSGTGTPGPAVPPGAPGQLSATPSSLTLQYPGPVSQTISIASSGAAVNYTATIQMSIALVNWLSLGTPSGAAIAGAPSSFQVLILPQNLQQGTYRTTLLVHPDNGAADLTIPIQLTVQPQAAPSTIAVSPASLNLSSIAGAGTFQAGSINVTGTGPAVQFSAATNGASWLRISPPTGMAPGQVVVAVNAAGLQAGNYNATITITAPGAVSGPQTIFVNLAVQPSQNLTVSVSSLTFASQAEGQAPPPQTIATAASTGSLTFTAAAATISPQGGNWLAVSPQSGTAGPAANLTVSVNPAGLAAGTYTGMVTVMAPGAGNSPQAVSVTYTISPLPAPAPTIVANAASNVPGPVSPGEIISIYGSNLGPPAGIATVISGGSVQTLISETQVMFDNIPAPLLFVSATQINTIVPYGVAGRASTRLAIVYKNTPSAALTLNIADAAPGIFVLNPAGQGAILNENGAVNGLQNPAARGSAIVLFATGEGVTSPFGTDGKIIAADITQLLKPVFPVTVNIGGYPAEVQYAGSAPGAVSGALQVNVVVPDNAPSGSAVPVVLTVGAINSPAATMAIQ